MFLGYNNIDTPGTPETEPGVRRFTQNMLVDATLEVQQFSGEMCRGKKTNKPFTIESKRQNAKQTL